MSFFFEDDLDDMYDYLPGQYVYGDDIYVPDEYMEEKWWYIDGFPDYMISNCGRVWSIKRQKFLTVKLLDDHGHMGVCLYRNGKPYYFYIHRLMAKAFKPNPNKLPIVRHIIDVPNYNEMCNLEWGTQADNIHDAMRNGTFYHFTKEDREKRLELQRRPILAVNIKTGEEIKFRSQTEAARELDLQQANVWKVLNGQRAHTVGWYFEYLDGGEE